MVAGTPSFGTRAARRSASQFGALFSGSSLGRGFFVPPTVEAFIVTFSFVVSHNVLGALFPGSSLGRSYFVPPTVEAFTLAFSFLCLATCSRQSCVGCGAPLHSPVFCWSCRCVSRALVASNSMLSRRWRCCVVTGSVDASASGLRGLKGSLLPIYALM